MKSLKDFVAKKSLSSDTLSKIASKTRFCSTHASTLTEITDSVKKESKTGNDGILVDTQGYDYPRYSAFIPNARQIVENFVQSETETVEVESGRNEPNLEM